MFESPHCDPQTPKDGVSTLSALTTLGRLALDVAHEMNNSLALISFILEEWNNDRSAENVSLLREETSRMTALVANLMDCRPTRDSGKATILLDSELKLCFQLIRPSYTKRHINTFCEIESNLPPLKANRWVLRQVFLNILLNAYDAMPGGGTLTVRAHLVTNSPPEALHHGIHMVCVEFQDTGVGMEPAIVEMLGNDFVTNKQDGHGIGWGIVRRAVADHRGLLAVHSELHVGTTVAITLPAG